MEELLTPKLDLVFKILFTSDTELLADLISSVLKLSGNRRIRYVKVKNPIVNPDEEITQKFVILDIHATDRKGRHYDIEMQVSRYEFYPKRTLFYACRLYTNQLASGKDYGKLMPVIGIHFLDYDEYPEYDDFHFCFGLIMKYTGLSRSELERLRRKSGPGNGDGKSALIAPIKD